MVVFAHYVLAFQPSLYYGRPPEAGAPWFAAGSWIASTPLVLLFSPQMALAVFFVLSGFVLAASVAAKPVPLAELAARRWIRLSGPVLWRPLQALLGAPVFGFLGRVSFMLYLVHVVVICTLGSWLVLRLMPLTGHNAACVLALPVLLGVALAVDSLGTRWVDQPCVRLAHRVGRWASGWPRLRRPRAIRQA